MEKAELQTQGLFLLQQIYSATQYSPLLFLPLLDSILLFSTPISHFLPFSTMPYSMLPYYTIATLLYFTLILFLVQTPSASSFCSTLLKRKAKVKMRGDIVGACNNWATNVFSIVDVEYGHL